MTKILLLSDTHSHMDKKILSFASKADEIWHAGDIGDIKIIDALCEVSKVRAVYGNIDDANIRSEYPKNNYFMCEKVSILMTHIGGYPNKYTLEARTIIRKHTPKLFICGHSHILKVIWDEKQHLLHMNPGAAGKYGFHKVRTMLQFEIEGEDIQKLEIIELSNRH